MERGDIYLVTLDPTVGSEQRGQRPVLVVSTGAFNRVLKVPIALPITSGGGLSRAAGFSVSLMGAGTQTTGVVLCAQPRALDITSRAGRWVERVPQYIMDEVLAKLAAILE